jgi:hypothetical protein
MNLNKYVEELGLALGETRRSNCPVCRGRNTFTASNMNGKILWNCYKASCSIKGTGKTNMSAADVLKVMRKGTEDTVSFMFDFNKPAFLVQQFSPAAIEWLTEWGIDSKHVLYDIKDHRVVFPVYHEGILVDAAGRAIGYRRPKWLRYGRSGLPYVHGEGDVCVLVEDCISAYVVASSSVTGLAILGTSLADRHIELLKQYRRVIVALDPDAADKTLKFTRMLRSSLPDVKALKLKDDLKYRITEDLQRLEDLVWS